MGLIVRKVRSFVRFCLSVCRSVVEGIKVNPDVRAWAKKHPRIVAFLAHRTTIHTFWGLPFTLLCIACIYAALALIGVVQHLATADVFASADVRIENLLFAFRSAPITIFFLWVTMLGSWKFAVPAIVACSLLLVIWKKEQYSIPLWITVAVSQLAGFIAKQEFQRPRPFGVNVYTEQSFSFPSGHAIVAITLYGFVIYILSRSLRKWKYKFYAFVTGITIILLIGISRLYVGVHYVSDVWGGYLLGFLWLSIGISLSEWIMHRSYPFPKSKRTYSSTARTWGTILVIIVLVSSFVMIGKTSVSTMMAHTPVVSEHDMRATDAISIFADGAPQYTETIGGNLQEPISFIITAPSEEVFRDAFMKAGWHSAEQISGRSIIRAAFAALTGKPYPTAPMTPSFWNQEVNDFGFEKPTEQDNIKERHHARFWRTPYVTDNGQRVYVGTASWDSEIKWFITHRIRPDIDSERAILLADLQQGGRVDRVTQVEFVEPVLGKNFFGDPFFTDGNAYVVELK